ncbi:hypothetical protein [Synechococcus sp. CCY 0621]|uniref:hypothetical protein n=1 Tax=Synechococcus sp. CCY 0621 TaxID=2815603 RepID=UPI001C224855|nr:hypothetical protein [Synechococcus sp. CCY 0621]
MTEFRAQCLELIRQVEKLAARLMPPTARSAQGLPPWTTLCGYGVLYAEPEESVLEDQAFDALR